MTTAYTKTIPIRIISLLPNLFNGFLEEGLVGQAVRDGQLSVEVVDYRQFGLGRHRKLDAPPYGGGAGMLLRPEPMFEAVESIVQDQPQRWHRILLSPQGQPMRQSKAVELAKIGKGIIFMCGRYEGFDERIRENLADEEISLGDFICQGGEVVAMAIIESVVRLLDNVLGNAASLTEESFAEQRLEYPQYTRPQVFRGQRVPDVLLSGDHGAIKAWRYEQSLLRTKRIRPDLLES